MADNKEVVLYLRIDGEEYGPLTVDDVKAWIDRGKFRRTDFIRMSDKKAWVKAENLVHLKALFDEAREKRERGAFGAWLSGIREGRPPMELSAVGRAEEEKRIAEEREALARERAVLEEQEQELSTRLETTIADRRTRGRAKASGSPVGGGKKTPNRRARRRATPTRHGARGGS